MSLNQQIRCRWREFRREPSASFWVVFMPILWMVVLGFAFSDPKPETYGVTFLGDDVLLEESLSKNPLIRFYKGDREYAETLLKRGKTELFFNQSPNGYMFYFDDVNPQAQRAKRFLDNTLQDFHGRENKVSVLSHPLRIPGLRYIDFLIPGLLALSIMSSSLFGVGMTIVSNRKENLLKRFLVTPMSKSEYLVSHIIGRLIIYVVEFLAIAVSGLLIFNFQVSGNYLCYVLVGALGAFSFTAIALTMASKARNVAYMAGIINLVSIPSIMLGGVFFSKEHFPQSVQPIIEVLPLTALSDALRFISLEGLHLSLTSKPIIILFVYLVIFTILARMRFKWQ